MTASLEDIMPVMMMKSHFWPLLWAAAFLMIPSTPMPLALEEAPAPKDLTAAMNPSPLFESPTGLVPAWTGDEPGLSDRGSGTVAGTLDGGLLGTFPIFSTV